MIRALLLLTCLLLAACDRDSPEALLQDYVSRVARASGQPIPRLQWPDVPAYPRHRERQLPVPEVRARLLDLTEFNTCNLTQLVAERNSILGRYWPASQRIDYELRFAHRLQRCRDWLAAQTGDTADPELLKQMDAIAAEKHGTLPAVFWQLSFDSPEFERHFSLANPWLAVGQPPPMAALIGLQQLANTLADPPDGWDLATLEPQLQTLALSGYGGAWAQATVGMTAALETAAVLLEALHDARPCPLGKPTPQARILETVFYRYYADRVQTYLAQLHQDGAAWQAALDPLRAAAPTPPPAFADYAARVLAQGPGSLRAALDAARQRHTDAWQAVLGDCGLMPDGRRPEGSVRTAD